MTDNKNIISKTSLDVEKINNDLKKLGKKPLSNAHKEFLVAFTEGNHEKIRYLTPQTRANYKSAILKKNKIVLIEKEILEDEQKITDVNLILFLEQAKYRVIVQENIEASKRIELNESFRDWWLKKVEQGWGKICILGSEPPHIHNSYISPKLLDEKCNDEISALSIEGFISELDKNNINKALVYASAGYGKTSLLKYLAVELNKQEKYSNYIAIPISLKRYNQISNLPLEDYIKDLFLEVYQEEVSELIKNGSVVFLLDGLDMDSGEQTQRIIYMVTNLINSFPKNKYLVTCKNPDYKIDEFRRFKLLGFKDEEKNRFIRDWLSFKSRKCGDKSEEFTKHVQNMIDIAKKAEMFTESPLHLSLLCLALYKREKEKIEEILNNNNHLNLFHEAIINLLKWDDERNFEDERFRDHEKGRIYKIMSEIQREELLGFISLQMIRDGGCNDVRDKENMYYVDSDMLIDWISQWLIDNWNPKRSKSDWFLKAEQILQDIEIQDGILIDRGYIGYSFVHTELRNYFAARAIAKQYGNKDILKSAIEMTTTQHKQKAMIQTLDALFDGETLVPEVPLNIKSGTRVRIIVESLSPDNKPTPKSFLQTAKSLKLQGQPDWSENIDQYLYGENISENA